MWPMNLGCMRSARSIWQSGRMNGIYLRWYEWKYFRCEIWNNEYFTPRSRHHIQFNIIHRALWHTNDSFAQCTVHSGHGLSYYLSDFLDKSDICKQITRTPTRTIKHGKDIDSIGKYDVMWSQLHVANSWINWKCNQSAKNVRALIWYGICTRSERLYPLCSQCTMA